MADLPLGAVAPALALPRIPAQRVSSIEDTGPIRHVARGRHRARDVAPPPWLAVPPPLPLWRCVARRLRATLWA